MAKNGKHITDTGTEVWLRSGKLHREDGPAITLINGTKVWYLNGKLHSVDGPAFVYPNGTVEYWLNDEQLDVLVWLVKREEYCAEERL